MWYVSCCTFSQFSPKHPPHPEPLRILYPTFSHAKIQRLKHKVKKGNLCPRTGHKDPEGEWRYSCILSLTSALDGGGWSTPRLCRLTPGKETRYTLNRRLGGAQGRSERVQKISPLTRIRSPDRPARSKSLYRLSYAGPQRLKSTFFLSLICLQHMLLRTQVIQFDESKVFENW